MLTRPVVVAVLATMLMSALAVAPAAAAKPVKPPPDSGPTERPLTAEEEAAAAAKFAAAQAYVASVAASGTDLATLNCVTPTASTSSGGETSTDGVGDAALQGCYVPQGFLTVYARDQENGAYCAPATGQVIANYTWAVASWANKYTQAQIAGWMGTNGGTDAFGVASGLETATSGAPRRPSNWVWLVQNLRDLNGNGDTGDELFTSVRANISGSAMPLAIAVKPHDPNATYWLSSWPRAVISPGHWIAAYGWVGIYTKGSGYSRLYFTDSSKDEGGSTGKFYNSLLSIKWMIDHHTGRYVW